jgi:isochorismate synthase
VTAGGGHAHRASLAGALAGGTSPEWPRWLDAGLAIARRDEQLTWIALPAPVADAAALIAAWPSGPAVAWTTPARAAGGPAGAQDPAAPSEVLVGLGAARVLTGRGVGRWREVIDGAAAIARGAGRAVIAGEPAERAALARTTLPRPRLLGGAAFAPGTADAAPWHGFGDAWFMLPRWTYAHDGARGYLVLAVDGLEAADPARWHAELERLHLTLASRGHAPRPLPAATTVDREAPDIYRAQLADIDAAIAAGRCSKIVAARTGVVGFAAPLRPADVLAGLDARQAACVRVMIRPGDGGALVAATPERLVRRDGATVRCDALAGSIARRGDDAASAAALLGSVKDKNEHDLVVREIARALDELGAAVAPPAAPTIRALAHVLHLHTPIHGELAAPRHLLELAARLHPTPAVGGTPTAEALAWIAAHEPTPRGWYAAPVGWFDLAGDGELAVAIRSGLLVDRAAHLWAGAGIVAGSDPDRELAETELKLRAMLGALGIAS